MSERGRFIPQQYWRPHGGEKDMAYPFANQGEQIPPGVHPTQLDFLHDAASVGAFLWVRVNTAKMIAEYYTTEATYADLAKGYGISVPAVRERITRGMGKMRRVLYRERPELAEEDKYPLEQIQKGKDATEVFKSEKSKQRRSQASSLRRPSKDMIRRPPNLP